MKTIYVIKTIFFKNTKIETFEDRKEWEDRIDFIAQHYSLRDRFEVSIYQVSENDENVERGRAGGYDWARIPESWELVDSQYVECYQIIECEHGGYRELSTGEYYDTEDEAVEFNAPSQFLTI
jgi:hypothetical protein